MPRDPAGAADTLQWVIAALNSIEMVTMPWWFSTVSGHADTPLASPSSRPSSRHAIGSSPAASPSPIC